MNEKKIVALCTINKMKPQEVAKFLNRDTRTIKNCLLMKSPQKRKDKGKFKELSPQTRRSLERTMKKYPGLTSREIFEQAGAKIASRSTRCRLLREFSKNVKPLKIPPLKKIHKEKRLF